MGSGDIREALDQSKLVLDLTAVVLVGLLCFFEFVLGCVLLEGDLMRSVGFNRIWSSSLR